MSAIRTPAEMCEAAAIEALRLIRSDSEAAAIARAIHSLAERIEPEWRPWETAPRDGRIILAWWDEETMETVAYRNGEWVWSSDGDSWAIRHPTYWWPCDWPLPTPPKPKEPENG